MKKKLTLFGLLTVFLLIFPVVQSQTETEKNNLIFIKREIGLTKSCTYYKIISDETEILNKIYEISTIGINTITEKEGKLENLEIQWEREKTIIDTLNNCSLIINETNKIKEDCGDHTTEIKTKEWETISKYNIETKEDSTLTARIIEGIQEKVNESEVKIRICGKHSFEKTEKGWGIEIDHIPEYKNEIYDKLDWWNETWQKARNITFTEPNIITRTNEPVKINITGLTIHSSAEDELRIINSSVGEDGSEIDFYVIDTDESTWAYITFIVSSITQNTAINYSVYYDNTTEVNKYTFSDSIMSIGGGEADCIRFNTTILDMQFCSGADSDNRNGIRYLADISEGTNIAEDRFAIANGLAVNGVFVNTDIWDTIVITHNSSIYKKAYTCETESGETLCSEIEAWGGSRYIETNHNFTGIASRSGMLFFTERVFTHLFNESDAYELSASGKNWSGWYIGAWRNQATDMTMGFHWRDGNKICNSWDELSGGYHYICNQDAKYAGDWDATTTTYKLWYGANTTDSYLYGKMLNNSLEDSFALGDEEYTESFPSGWDKVRPITIDSSNIGEDLTDFPLLLTNQNFPKEVWNSSSEYHALSTGCDIRFSSDLAGTTELPFEIVSFDLDESTGSEIYVKTTLDADANTTIYIWYNNSDATCYADSDTYGADNVWRTEYELVLHDGSKTDSTSNAYQGTELGGVTADGVAGKIGNATFFDGSDDAVNHTGNISNFNTSYTFTFWTNPETVSDASASNVFWFFEDNKIQFRSEGDGRVLANHQTTTSTALYYQPEAAETWASWAMRWNNTDISIFKNGAEVNYSAQTDDTPDNNGDQDAIGARARAGQAIDRLYNGSIDELRVYNGSLSADWLSAEYANQNSPNTFAFEQTLSVSIAYPVDDTAYGSNITTINYTSTLVDDCWYSIDDGTTNSSTVSAGTNFTGVSDSSYGDKNWTVWCNNSLGDIVSDNVSFSLEVVPVIVYPEETIYTEDITEINYTVGGPITPHSCWYSIDGGITNSTSVLVGTNFTGVTDLDDERTWTLWCNDTSGNVGETSATFISIASLKNNWLRKALITINSSEIDEDLTNHVILLTEDVLPEEMFDEDGAYPARASGSDVWFSTDEEGTTFMDREIVDFDIDNDPSNGRAEIWVKVPSISSSTDTEFWVWWDNSDNTIWNVTDYSSAADGYISTNDTRYNGQVVRYNSTHLVMMLKCNKTLEFNSICALWSTDGENWNDINGGDGVMDPAGGTVWDSTKIFPEALFYDSDSGIYHLYYMGHNGSGSDRCSGHATTTDDPMDWTLSSWTRDSDNPFLCPDWVGDWKTEDATHTLITDMVEKDGVWYWFYYVAKSLSGAEQYWDGKISYLTTDTDTWSWNITQGTATLLPNAILEAGSYGKTTESDIRSPDIIFYEGWYYMLYWAQIHGTDSGAEAKQGNTHWAISKDDGFNASSWIKGRSVLIELPEADDTWHSDRIYTPSVLKYQDTWNATPEYYNNSYRLYYSGFHADGALLNHGLQGLAYLNEIPSKVMPEPDDQPWSTDYKLVQHSKGILTGPYSISPYVYNYVDSGQLENHGLGGEQDELNSPNETSNGIINTAHDFELGNTDSIRVKRQDSDLDLTTNLTIKTFIKLESAPSGAGTNYTIVDKMTNGSVLDRGYALFVDEADDKIYFRIKNISDTFDVASPAISAGTWYYVVASFNGSHQSITLNETITVLQQGSNIATNLADLDIGARLNYSGTSADAYFDGLIDDLIIVDADYVEGDNATFRNVDNITQFVSVGAAQDVSLPEYSLNLTNSTVAGTDILHSLYWEDNLGLSGYIFSWDNGSGAMANDSWVSFGGATTGFSNVTKYSNITSGTTISWCVYANDTDNNWNMTSCDSPFTYVTVKADPYPPFIDFVSPTPDDDNETIGLYFEANVSVTNASDFEEFRFDWNGTNESYIIESLDNLSININRSTFTDVTFNNLSSSTIIFDEDIHLILNFDNLSALSECTVRNTADCIKDASLEDNHARLGNSTSGTDPTWTSSGKYDGAFIFDGTNDFINVSNEPNFDFGTGNFSISLWLRLAGTAGNQVVLTKKYIASAANQAGYSIKANSAENLLFEVSDGTSRVISGGGTATTSWNHFAFVYDGDTNTTYAYKNGVQVDTDTVANIGSTDNNYNIYIGKEPWQGVHANMTLDELRIWNRTLTASEIDFLYQSNLQNYDTDSWNYNISQVLTSFEFNYPNNNIAINKHGTDSYFFYLNKTSLTEGNYTYQGWVKDTSDNWNSTEQRTVTITEPYINITYPYDDEWYAENITTINYTLASITGDKCWYSIDGGTTNSSTVSAGTNFTGVSDSGGTRTWTLWCNDTSGTEYTDSVTFRITETIYIDPSAATDGVGNFSNPYNNWSSVSFQNGNTYLQKRGTVANRTYLNVNATGKPGAWLVIGAYGTGSDPILDGLYFNNSLIPGTHQDPNNTGIFIYGGYNYIKVENYTIRNYRRAGMMIGFQDTMHDIIIRNMNFTNNSYGLEGDGKTYNSYGMKIFGRGAANAAYNMLIDNCTASFNGGPGYHIVHVVQNVTFQNTDAYNNTFEFWGGGFSVWDGTHKSYNTSVYFYNCTSYNNQDAYNHGDGFLIDDYYSNIIIYNSTAYGNNRYGFENHNGTNNTYAYVVAYNNGNRGFSTNSNGEVNVTNCIIHNNGAVSQPANATNCIVINDTLTTGDGNMHNGSIGYVVGTNSWNNSILDMDNLATNDYTIGSNSHAVNNGTTVSYVHNALWFKGDRAGNSISGSVDLGVYEFIAEVSPNCWRKTAGRLYIPTGCVYYTNIKDFIMK